MRNRRIFSIVLLSLSAAVYDIYYLATVFYIPFRSAFGYTNAQMGELVSTNAIFTMISLAFSGWLCERISPKICLTISVIGTGCLSVWMSTMPDYGVMKLIYLFMAITHFCWSPYVKCLHMLGDVNEQGRIFGFSTMIEGTLSTSLYIFPTVIWGNAVGTKENFSRILFFFGIFFIAVGICVMVFFDYRELQKQRGENIEEKASLREIGKVMRMPAIWMIGFIQFTSYATLACLTYISPYLNSVFVLPVALAASFGILSRFGIRAVATPVGGMLRDRMRSTAKSLITVNCVTILCFIGLLLVPQKKEFSWLAAGMAGTVFFGYMMNANAANIALGDIRPPDRLMGIMVGVYSAIASSSNLLVPPVAGNILDRFGNNGYRLILAGICLFQLLSILCGYLLMKMAASVSEN